MAKEWPKNENTKNVPKPDFGEITFVLNVGGITSITMKNVSRKEVEAYIKELKAAGFTKQVTESCVISNIYYGAVSEKDGTHVSVNASMGSTTIALDRISASIQKSNE